MWRFGYPIELWATVVRQHCGNGNARNKKWRFGNCARALNSEAYLIPSNGPCANTRIKSTSRSLSYWFYWLTFIGNRGTNSTVERDSQEGNCAFLALLDRQNSWSSLEGPEFQPREVSVKMNSAEYSYANRRRRAPHYDHIYLRLTVQTFRVGAAAALSCS